MARGRIVSTTIAVDEEFNAMSVDAQFMFVRAVPHLDRDGLITGSLASLWAQIAPLLPQYMGRMGLIIDEWIERDFVVRYKDDKKDVLFFKGFSKNQVNMRYDREAKSAFKPPPGYTRTEFGLEPTGDSGCNPSSSESSEGSIQQGEEAPQTNSGVSPECIRTDSGLTPSEEKRREEKRKEPTPPPTPPLAEEKSCGGGGGAGLAPEKQQQIADTVMKELAENEFGKIPELGKRQVERWVESYPYPSIHQAIAIAVGANKFTLNYVEGVLKRDVEKGNKSAIPKMLEPEVIDAANYPLPPLTLPSMEWSRKTEERGGV